MSSCETVSAGRPPILGDKAVVKLVQKYYNFKHVNEMSIKSFPSYRDRNFYFRGVLGDRVETEVDKSSDEEKEFILKVNNSFFSSFEVLSGICKLMLHLHAKGFGDYCIHPIDNRSGDHIMQVDGKELLALHAEEEQDAISESTSVGGTDSSTKMKFPVRVMTYIPGELLDDVEKKYLTPKLFYEFGRLIGRIDTELKTNFRCEALESAILIDWDLYRFLDNRTFLPALDDPKHLQLANRVFDLFEKHVSPKMPSFQRGIIYGDSNGMNVILKKSKVADEFELAGVIDFGDVAYTCYVFELSILLAYTMLENLHPVLCANPFEHTGPLVSGYLQAFPLSEEEVSSLYYLILARCCQSAVIGMHSYKQEPWNAYVLTSQMKSWEAIELILSFPKEEVDRIWSKFIKMSPSEFES